MTRHYLLHAALIAMMIGAGGCKNKKLNLRNIEAAASEEFARRSGMAVTSVTCPESVRTKKGDKFECTVVFEDSTELVLVVEQLGAGKTAWRPRSERVVYANELEPLIQQRLRDQGKETTVKCDQRVYLLDPGETFICRVFEVGGSVRFMEISYNEHGEQQVRFVPPPVDLPTEPLPPPETPAPSSSPDPGAGDQP